MSSPRRSSRSLKKVTYCEGAFPRFFLHDFFLDETPEVFDSLGFKIKPPDSSTIRNRRSRFNKHLNTFQSLDGTRTVSFSLCFCSESGSGKEAESTADVSGQSSSAATSLSRDVRGAEVKGLLSFHVHATYSCS